MTKAQLVELLEEYNDDDIVVIEVHDTVLYEDLYDFDIDGIPMNTINTVTNKEVCEIRLMAINQHEK